MRDGRIRIGILVRMTAHAMGMIAARGIAQARVEATLAQPDSRSQDPSDATLTRSYRAIDAADGRILRVVHRPDGTDVLVITAFFGRGARP